IDHARRKRAAKRGGGGRRLNIDAIDLAAHAAPDQLLALDDALDKLSRSDPAAARLVGLRYFGGLTVEEAGKALRVSTATAPRPPRLPPLEVRPRLAAQRASGRRGVVTGAGTRPPDRLRFAEEVPRNVNGRGGASGGPAH